MSTDFAVNIIAITYTFILKRIVAIYAVTLDLILRQHSFFNQTVVVFPHCRTTLGSSKVEGKKASAYK
jgi:hypothetical protein